MSVHAFSYVGEGTVVCHGDPPLYLRIDDVDTPCPDPLAEWCRWEPGWTLGTHTVACVNAAGPSDPVVVEVPEPDGFLAFVLAFLVVVALAWVVKGAR